MNKPLDPNSTGSRGFAVAATLLVVASVVFFIPDLFGRWFLPKELLAVVAVVCASLASAAGRLPRAFWVLVGTAGVILLVATLFSAAPLAALFGRWPRYEGLASLPVYVTCAWLGARLFGPSAPHGRMRLLTWAVAASAILLAVVSLAESLGLTPIATDLARPGALLGNASDQGIVAAIFTTLLSLPLYRSATGRLRARRDAGIARPHMSARSTGGLRSPHTTTSRGRAAGWGTVVLALAFSAALLTVMLSGSRAGLLGLLVSLLAVGIVLVVQAHYSGDRHGVRLPLILGTGLVLVLAAVLSLVPAMRDRVFGLSAFAQRTIDDRLLIWGESVRLLAESPLLGVGPSGYLDAISTRHGEEWYRQVSPGTVLDSPHNWVLQAALAGGIPLLLVALAFCALLCVSFTLAMRHDGALTAVGVGVAAADTPTASIKKGGRAERARAASASALQKAQGQARLDMQIAAFAALLGLGTALLTHFTAAATGILGGLLVGIVLAVAPRAAHRGWMHARSALFVVWLVLMAITVAADAPLQRALTATAAIEANTELEAAWRMRPWDGDLASIAAQSLTARADAGDPNAASAALVWAARALAIVPDNIPTQLAEGVSLRLNRQYEQSVERLSNLTSILPHDANVAVQHGLSLAGFGDLPGARAEFERAARLRPNDAEIQDMLGQLP